MKTIILATLAAMDVYAVQLARNIMLVDISSLSPIELMQRCHTKPTDCSGMYKIPVKKLQEIVKAKEVKVKAAKLAKKLLAKKELAKAAKVVKSVKKMAKTIKSAKAMSSKQLTGEMNTCHDPKKCKSNVGKLPTNILKKLIAERIREEEKELKIKRAKRKARRIIRRKKRAIRRKIRKIKAEKKKAEVAKVEIHIKAKAELAKAKAHVLKKKLAKIVHLIA
jgi:hypothetical protein